MLSLCTQDRLQSTNKQSYLMEIIEVPKCILSFSLSSFPSKLDLTKSDKVLLPDSKNKFVASRSQNLGYDKLKLMRSYDRVDENKLKYFDYSIDTSVVIYSDYCLLFPYEDNKTGHSSKCYKILISHPDFNKVQKYFDSLYN